MGDKQRAEKAAAEVFAQHQHLIAGPCLCGSWPDRHCRDGQTWNEHVAERLADAGLLPGDPVVTAPKQDGEAAALRDPAGYTRDRSFYASRPSGSGVKVHRESLTAPGMAACNTRRILLYLDNEWDVARTRRDAPSILCRRCFPPGKAGL